MLDLRLRGCRFEPHRRHCVVVLEHGHIYPSLVLVQPRKTRPCLTERLLMGRKESNETNKNQKPFKATKSTLNLILNVNYLFSSLCGESNQYEIVNSQYLVQHMLQILAKNVYLLGLHTRKPVFGCLETTQAQTKSDQ